MNADCFAEGGVDIVMQLCAPREVDSDRVLSGRYLLGRVKMLNASFIARETIKLYVFNQEPILL